MKRILLFFAFFFSYLGLAYANSDQLGSQRQNVWRSSVTLTNDTNVVIATGATCIIHAVTVDTPGSGSKIELFDNDVTTVGAKRAVAPLDTTSKNANAEWNVICSSGIVYNTSGATPASVTILWDYVIRPSWVKN